MEPSFHNHVLRCAKVHEGFIYFAREYKHLKMKKFIERQRNLYPISGEGIEMLLRDMQDVNCRKGEILVREGQRGRDVYFVKSGLLRTYVVRDGKDITLWFSTAGDMVVDMPGGVSSVNVEILEDSVLLMITQSKLDVLFEHSLEMANWGRKLLEHYLLEYEHYFTTYSWTDAGEQYERLAKVNPELLQKVPLKHIASYLQITPQSLSRIRAKIKCPDSTKLP